MQVLSTISVADSALRFPQCAAMLSQDEIREEMIRQLDAGDIRPKDVADVLKIPSPRVAEMRKRERRVQYAEMQPLARFLGMSEGRDGAPLPAKRPPSRGANDDAQGVEMVGIRHADAAFGLGSAFTDEPPEIEVLQFPKVWVQSITYSPAELLSWVRARGRSMEPTISDGDLILLDHSERRVEDQDDLWAFTVGDTRAIKRLRVKGDRYQILSDNPSVPDDEEPIDFVNIVARVVFVGKRT